MLTRRECRGSTRGELGFTLVEVLVVLVLMGVIGGVTTTAVVASLRSAENTSSRIAALQEIEVALQRVTRDLRLADPLRLSDEATAGDFTPFETDLGARIFRDGAEDEVRYRLVGDPADGSQRLVREETGQTLVTLVDNGGEPLFTYLTAEGEPIVCPPTDSLFDCEERLGGAKQVKIELVRSLGEDKGSVRAETIVTVRSMRYRG